MQKDPHETTEQESFLGRWSRRKSKTETPPDTTEPAPEPPESTLSPEAPEDTPVLTDEDMPPIESLDQDSDYSGFMSEGVSETLRKMALRKLFRGAGFNIRDGLDDYDDDFTRFPALGDLITSDMKHQKEMTEKREAEAREAAEREAAAQETHEREEDAVEQEEEIGDDRASPDSGEADVESADDVPGDDRDLPGESNDDPSREPV